MTGTESPTLSTSEDTINKMGNASPVTIYDEINSSRPKESGRAGADSGGQLTS